MQSASTTKTSSASELSKIAQQKAIRGQPTLANRVSAAPVAEPPPAQERNMGNVDRVLVDRVVARPLMGRPTVGQGQAPAVAPGTTTLNVPDAKAILAGLQETLRLVDNAKTTGWTCSGASDATLAQGRALRDRLSQFVAGPSQAMFQITSTDVDVADQILACSNAAGASQPNLSPYIALGVVVAAAAVFFTLVDLK